MVGRRLLVLLVAVSIGHILLISSQVQSRRGLPVIQEVSFGLFASVQRATSAIADTGTGIWRHYFALRGVTYENESLRARVIELEGQLQQQQARVAATRALEEALALKTTTAQHMLVARVMAGAASPGALTVTIDRGSDDGVAVDMAVVGARGIVGRVIGPVSPHAALVQLLIGRNAAAAVTFERSGAGAMVVGGSSDGLLRGEYVPILADIQVGERVTTSGQDQIYPAGFLVGTVERVAKSGANDREIVVRPATDFSHVELVLVVLPGPKPAGGGQ
jgi:rod shape-determining protein MreC